MSQTGTSQQLEERKLKEIEHSRRRRSILQGFERSTDTNPDETAALDTLVRDREAFEEHFSNMKFYSVATESEQYLHDWLEQRCANARALDYCCGNGENALFMAAAGAQATGIDISPEGIENCRRNASESGVADRATFAVMDGEALEFADNTFDVIAEYGALHHLDYDKAMSELRRVIRPDGEIICVEALKHNPLIHLYRRRTPTLRTEWEVEHILTVDHLRRAREYFGKVEVRFFHLMVLAAVPFRKTRVFRPMRTLLEKVDKVVLSNQMIGKYAWIMVFTLAEPRKSAVQGGQD
jgi:ubiquinone/menaquinone biosynthesis C-methylase UbiE